MIRPKRRIKIKRSPGWFAMTGELKLQDRLRVQAELVEELTALLDMDRDIIIIRDMEDRIVFWNRGAQDLFGLSKEDACSKRYSDLPGMKYPVSFQEIKNKLLAQGRWEGEISCRGRSGEGIILESRLRLQKDESGVPIAILEIDHNITDRKNAEALLRESEQLYRYICDNSPDMAFICDLNLRPSFISGNIRRVLGAEPDEIMQKGLKVVMTQNSYARAKSIIDDEAAAAASPSSDPGRLFVIEAEMLSHDKVQRLFEFKASFIKGSDPKPKSILAVGRDVTDRHDKEKKLHQHGQLCLSFLHKFHGIAYRCGLTGAPVIFDGAVEEITGYKNEDFLQARQSWEKLIHSDDREKLKGSWDNIRTSAHYSAQREYRIIRKDKQVRWVHENTYNLCDESGRPAFVEGTVYDITEKKKSCEDLAWLASFPEMNPNPVVETDVDGRIFYMSPAAGPLLTGADTLGAKHPYLTGLRWVRDRIIEEKRPFFSREAEVGGLWYTQKIYLVENNTRLRIYGVDITESKLNADKLRGVNQQLMDIIEFLPDATFVIDRNKRIIAWNKALEEMTDSKKEDMIGKGDYQYAVPFYGKPRPVIIDLIFKTDKELESRYSYIKRSKSSLVAEVFIPKLNKGKGMFVWIKVAPLYDDKGAVIGAIESVRDISEHKESEAILRQDREAFEDLVKAKTEELLRMQKELADAKHLSEIGALAATIAHELRNPLAAIRTAAYNIRRKSAERNLTSHLDNIEKKVIESDQIISNLLSYSRIRTPHLERVDIHELLEECLKAAKDRFDKFKVKVTKTCTCKKGDFIHADPLHMKELFNNILNNSYESFVAKSGVIIIKADYAPRGKFTVSFSDNGSGISPDDMKKISQPFFTTKSKGTGLGLTVCYQLVSLHNGTMDIKSEAGKGTTVTIILPSGGV
ncbi:MAG: PAS domain S-box protein [Candidatus Omnitrophica bacterium]|nr:PAS domain S-box protein [Candidatus Omnitrophota bacterium]